MSLVKKLIFIFLICMFSFANDLLSYTYIETKDEDGNTYGSFYNYYFEDAKQADAYYQAALAQIKNNTQSPVFYETAALYTTNNILAEKYYKKAIQLNPSSSVYLNNLGVFYITKENNVAKALQYFQKSLQDYYYSQHQKTEYGADYHRMHNIYFQNLLNIYKKDKQLVVIFDDFEFYIAKIDKEDISSEEKELILSATCAALDKAVSALTDADKTILIPVWEKLVNKYPNYSYPFYLLGCIYAEMNNYSEAEKWLLMAKEINPEIVDIPMQLSYIYNDWTEEAYLAENYTQVLNISKRITKQLPDDYVGLYNQACAYALMDKKEEAIDCLKKALAFGSGTYAAEIQLKAKEDPDFTNIKDSLEFKNLIN